jgi:hypothetical protein
MISVFCFRLALGMLSSLWLLPAPKMHPRFFRTHFLTVLALTVVAGWMVRVTPETSHDALENSRWIAWATAFGALLGAIAWMFEKPPGGWLLVALCSIGCLTALMVTNQQHLASPVIEELGRPMAWVVQGIADLTSAMLLGFAVTAMLVGHSYLISPGLSIRPLLVQIVGFGIAWLGRVAVAAWALWFWMTDHDITNFANETNLWLPVRWLVGFGAPLLCGVMAFRTAQIRSTQSATGILYVVVILVFLGELFGLLLARQTGLPL